MAWVTTGLVLATMLTSTLGGTIDPRYPDYIVDPLVPCPAEGSYPHPRDCTWFYRCYDRYGLGFFSRAYFQCEPGTVFDDNLDQCVGGTPENDCRPRQPVCQIVTSECRETALCPSRSAFVWTTYVETKRTCKAVRSCNDGYATTNEPLCGGAALYDEEAGECISTDDVCAMQQRPITMGVYCEDELDICDDLYICSAAAPTVLQVVRQCRLIRTCYGANVVLARFDVCPQDHSFDAATSLCVPTLDPWSFCDSGVISTAPELTFPECRYEGEKCFPMDQCEAEAIAFFCQRFFTCDGATIEIQPPGSGLHRGTPPGAEECLQMTDSATPVEPTCDPAVAAFGCSPGALCDNMVQRNIPGFVPSVRYCSIAQHSCSDGSKVDVCEPGLLYDTSSQSCFPSSALCPPIQQPPTAKFRCNFKLESCADYTVCPAGGGGSFTARRCNLKETCKDDQGTILLDRDMCPVGSFDLATMQCESNSDLGKCPGEVGVTPVATPSCREVAVPCRPLPVCRTDFSVQLCTPQYACEPNYIPDSQRRRFSSYRNVFSLPVSRSECHTIEALEKPCTAVKVSGCRSAQLCTGFQAMGSSAVLPSLTLCSSAVKDCPYPPVGGFPELCPAGSLYNQENGNCIAEADLCQLLPRQETEIQCTDMISACQDYYRCPSGVPTLRRMCVLKRQCIRDGVVIHERNLCSDGGYDALSNQCVTREQMESYPCTNAPTVQPPTCQVVAETCTMKDVCSVDLQTLSCFQAYSCSGGQLTAVLSQRMALPTRRQEVQCEPIPELIPVTCGAVTGNCRVETICRDDISKPQFLSTYDLCYNANYECSNGTSTPLCEASQLFAPSVEKCFSYGSLCPSIPARSEGHIAVCEIELSQCRSTHACDQYGQLKTAKRCNLERVCRDGAEEKLRESICKSGSEFDVNLNECVAPLQGVACPPQTILPDPWVANCAKVQEKCYTVPICDSDETALLCSSFYGCLSPLMTTPNTEPWAAPQCVDRPDVGLPLVPGGGKLDIEIVCNRKDEIPFNEELRQYRCETEMMCYPNGMFAQTSREVCKEFYRCAQQGNSLVPVKSQCPEGEILAFNELKCIPIETDEKVPCSKFVPPSQRRRSQLFSPFLPFVNKQKRRY